MSPKEKPAEAGLSVSIAALSAAPMPADPFPVAVAVDPAPGLPHQPNLWTLDIVTADPKIGTAVPLPMARSPDHRLGRSRRRGHDFRPKRRRCPRSDHHGRNNQLAFDANARERARQRDERRAEARQQRKCLSVHSSLLGTLDSALSDSTSRDSSSVDKAAHKRRSLKAGSLREGRR